MTISQSRWGGASEHGSRWRDERGGWKPETMGFGGAALMSGGTAAGIIGTRNMRAGQTGLGRVAESAKHYEGQQEYDKRIKLDRASVNGKLNRRNKRLSRAADDDAKNALQLEIDDLTRKKDDIARQVTGSREALPRLKQTMDAESLMKPKYESLARRGMNLRRGAPVAAGAGALSLVGSMEYRRRHKRGAPGA